MAPPFARDLALDETDTGGKILSYPCPERLRQQLMAQAETEIGHIPFDGPGDKVFSALRKG